MVMISAGAAVRRPLQGVRNIIRFNWHFYVLALWGMLTGWWIIREAPVFLQVCGQGLIFLAMISTLLSLMVSWYIYDWSGLYELHWLEGIDPGERMVNVHAGFDETSFRLQQQYPQAVLAVFDFYDPRLHTEISIERARRVYRPFPGTQTITTTAVPLETASADTIWVLLAAHEIRHRGERIAFFQELCRCLKITGKIVVLEHLRDTPNCLAYNIGCLHFLSRSEWACTFSGAGLTVEEERKVTPFLSAFILVKNGTTA
ncbi:methyltransferase [Chitinophaga sp. 30R24]|uniref:methyltransferase n=1 Tax=Chitinophaga sp. 30R24 TaxID=3248838 RepID=UPI003B8F3064